MNTTEERGNETSLCDNLTLVWINAYLDPRKMVDRVETFLIVAVVFMIVLAFGAPRRRQSQSIIIRYAVEGVFVLSFPLLSYTLGLMQGQVIKNVLYPVWAMFLVMLFGGTNAMSVQKLDDNNHLVNLYVNYMLFMLYIGSILAIFTFVGQKLPYKIVAYIVISLFAFRNTEQLFTAQLASKPSSENGIKWLALYMKREQQLSTSHDPRTMQGYKYAVLIHAGSSGTRGSPITLEEIWSDNIGVLSNTGSPRIRRLKDLCLSFSLFHLVVRRYFGYPCLESRLQKTRDLVDAGLLRTEQDYERAFQVIEAELAFLYDFFFTKYAFIMYGNEVRRCALPLTITFVTIAVGAWSISVLNTGVSVLEDSLLETNSRDVLVTKIVLAALSMFQLAQILSYCVSDWAKVSLVCKYATHPSWQGNARIEKLLDFLGRPHKCLRYWRNTIGQYSALDSFRSKYLDRLKYYLFQIRKLGKAVELTMEVKKAVARAIKISVNGQLSNGASALMRHGMSDHLSWACKINHEFTLTHSILLWHVATCYCEISEMVRRPDGIYVHPNQGVATRLSKYCAYLVAFVPTLLPGSAIESECTLDDLEREAKETLQYRVSPREKYEKLRELQNVDETTASETAPAKLLAKGVMLGKALESRTIRWRVCDSRLGVAYACRHPGAPCCRCYRSSIDEEEQDESLKAKSYTRSMHPIRFV